MVENGLNASGEIRMTKTVVAVRTRGRKNLLESSGFCLLDGEKVLNGLAIFGLAREAGERWEQVVR